MNLKQLTDTVVMIEPNHFGFNPETALTNPFQHKPNNKENHVQETALNEFNQSVNTLINEGIEVLILKSREDVITPDSIFPNNWFTHHQGGTLIVYPMLAENRRVERQTEKLVNLLRSANVPVTKIIDLTIDENNGDILEGTGSLVLDRVNKVAYAMSSPRTIKEEFDKWCELNDYTGIYFHAYDKTNMPIYHTNVAMALGDGFTIICPEAIIDEKEREAVINSLKKYDKEIISITREQVFAFCGNVLHVINNNGEKKIIMSETAYNNFSAEQIKQIEKYGKIIKVNIPVIETIGGGSARCMLAEVFRNT